ncbi:MAG: adenylate kinase [Pseudomonas fluorescens]|nr:MAG: adenylate kinase [Pseudomonas fluorescens]
MLIVLFGPPGAGKGTQSENLAKKFNIPSLSTGDMFRAAIADETPVGVEVKSVMEAGDLVNDELVNRLVFERIEQDDCKNGVILDGYPRTVAQAKALDKWLESHPAFSLEKVVELKVDDEALIERRAGRLYAPKSKKVYHKQFNPPKVEGICDVSGEKLIQRDDDKPEVVRHRLDVYNEQTAPVLGYYLAQNRLVTLDGMANIDEVFANILKVLGAK